MDVRQKKDILDKIPIQRLLAVGLPRINFYSTTTGYQALCPFHKDSHLGSFTVNPHTGVWKCFACGEGGRGVYKLIMRLNNCSFTSAVDYLYDHMNDPVLPFETTIPPSLLGKGRSICSVKPINASHSSTRGKHPLHSQKEQFLNHLPVSAEDLNRIYLSFAASSPLTQAEIKKLQAKRGLTYLSAKDFFRFPSNWDMAFWARFRQALQLYDYVPGEERLYHSLIGVPGFYWDIEDDRPAFICISGSLGLLNHNLDGLVNGIELRTKADDGKTGRYIGFSSASICLREPTRCILGTKSDAIIDVVPRAYSAFKGVAITEGKFKAIHLSYKGYLTLNVHGIYNWKKALPVLKKTGTDGPITIVFDADMQKNASVAKMAAELANGLFQEGYKDINFLTWPLKYGKGFDDLCNAGYYGRASVVPAGEFLKSVLNPFLEQAKREKDSNRCQ